MHGLLPQAGIASRTGQQNAEHQPGQERRDNNPFKILSVFILIILQKSRFRDSHETLIIVRYNKNMQVLIVEDEPKIAQLIRRGLIEEHYAVDIAYDGHEAIEKFETNEYDCIVLDWLLPGQDGLAVCQTIRRKNVTVPILMLTAKGDISDKVAALDSGADDYLTKPFSFNELTARIRALLRRGNKADPAILTVDDLELNPATRRAVRAGHEISLTAREYALLEYLMRNKNIALSKTQILDHVWDYSYDGFSNIVETYIRYLRKKLQISPESRELIHTVRGHGYIIKGNGHV
jgi:DNA-binding response OmpR family regulator